MILELLHSGGFFAHFVLAGMNSHSPDSNRSVTPTAANDNVSLKIKINLTSSPYSTTMFKSTLYST
jgi:hypothetical protein